MKELKNKETDAFEAFKEADLPKDKNMLYGENEEIDLDLLIKGRSICRTGRLPAMSRYLGYTTNTDKIGGATAFQFEQYDTGIEMGKATLARREEEERDGKHATGTETAIRRHNVYHTICCIRVGL